MNKAAVCLGLLIATVPGLLHAQSGCTYKDDFEPSANPGWTVDTAVNDAGTPAWAVGTEPASHSPSRSFVEDATGFDTKDDRLIAPPQDLTAASHLVFWHKYFFEFEFDGGVLEVSTDGGSTWVDVVEGGGSFVSGGYDGQISTEYDSAIAGRNAWTIANDNYPDSMNKVEVDLGAFAGPARLIRWRFVGDPGAPPPLGGSLPGDRWAIDDVEFTVVEGCDGGEEPPPTEDTRLVLHFHGNPTHDAGDPNEPDCTGDGASDLLACDGPFLSPVAELASAGVGDWSAAAGVNGGENPRNTLPPVDPNWVWHLTDAQTLESPMKVLWWGSCGGCAAGVSTADWTISLLVDDALVVSQRVTATPKAANTASLLAASVDIGEVPITANSSVVVKIDPFYSGSQQNTHIYYDSTLACPTSTDTEVACDSRLVFGPEPAVNESVCLAPGQTLFTDPVDASGAPEQELLHAWLGQPFVSSGTPNLVFTLETSKGSGLPPSSTWFISFLAPDGENRGVRAVTGPSGALTFQSYAVAVTSSTSRKDGRYAVTGSTKPLEAESNYDPSSGRFTFVVNPADIGVASAGENLTQINSGAMQVTPTGGTLLHDEMPDGSVLTAPPDNAFAVPANSECAPNAAPIASLTADKTTGAAPLEVTFTVTGSDPEGEDLVSFSLDFGDGFSITDQPFAGPAATVRHSYDGGTFHPSLTVKDPTGKESSAAQLTITVTGPPIARAGDDVAVSEGDAVALDGSASSGGNSGSVSYSWSQVSGTEVVMTGANTANVAFTAPEVCDTEQLSFRLSVTNSAGVSTDDVVVTVENINQAPVANAGADRIVRQGDKVRLDGTATSDADECQALTVQWVQALGPLVSLNKADTLTPSFTAPESNQDILLGFRLTVTDPQGASSESDVFVTVRGGPFGFTKVGSLPPLGLLLLALFGALGRHRRTALTRR